MDLTNYFIRPMPARDSNESHRAATTLELFYDLISVIAIASAATALHHAIAEDHIGDGLIKFVAAFFAIWWAWMNFTWFASAYDNNDVLYRIAVMVMMVGALIFAAGIPSFFAETNSFFGLIGYVIMRLSMGSLWLRAAKHDPERRQTAYRYAIGVTLCQVGWILGFFLVPIESFLLFYGAMIVCELLVPAIAERAAQTTWHMHHIIERYGLLTIIVLGESFVALTRAVEATIDIEAVDTSLIIWIVAGLVIVFMMWWLYFSESDYVAFKSLGTGFLWGYGHFIIFAAATGVGVGLAVGVDVITDHAAVGQNVAVASVTIPAAIFVLGIWLVHEQFSAEGMMQKLLMPATAALILICSFIPSGQVLTALILVVCLVFKLNNQKRRALAHAV